MLNCGVLQNRSLILCEIALTSVFDVKMCMVLCENFHSYMLLDELKSGIIVPHVEMRVCNREASGASNTGMNQNISVINS